jgi:hypothetical protein
MDGYLFELYGDGMDRLRLRPLAHACNCTIPPGPDSEPWLGGTRFDGMTPEQALPEAKRALTLLNGLARLENLQHRIVELGDTYRRDSSIHHIRHPPRPRRGSLIQEFLPPTLGPGPWAVPPTDAAALRRAHIVADPSLAEILEVFAAPEMTWQKQRVAFEKIEALVGRGDNALVKHGYATSDEVTRFKKNVEDPRHSGVDAVHGVPTGPLKGTKMTEQEGFSFVVRLFNSYVDRHPGGRAKGVLSWR